MGEEEWGGLEIDDGCLELNFFLYVRWAAIRGPAEGAFLLDGLVLDFQFLLPMRNPFTPRFGRIVVLLAAQCGAAQAVTIASDFSDGAAYGSGSFNSQDLIVGGATGANYAGIAIFQLPSLGMGGSISAATLTFTVKAAGTMSVANADIYGLGYVTSPPAMQGSWLLASDTETRNGNALGTNIGTSIPVKLVDNAVTAGTTMAVNDTTVVTGAGLVSFLNDLYSVHGAQAGDFAVFRVNPDADQYAVSGAGGNFRYGGSQHALEHTTLDISTVPEVSAMFLTAFGASGLLFRRRRAPRGGAVC